MLRIIQLLNQKNHYLEKFYSTNETGILNFSAGNFDGLEEFYQTREKVLEMIKHIDQELDRVQLGSDSIASIDLKNEIREALAIKEEYVSRIIAQDLEILSCIESAKSEIIRELRDLRHSRRVVGSYKSQSLSRGHLDEEA